MSKKYSPSGYQIINLLEYGDVLTLSEPISYTDEIQKDKPILIKFIISDAIVTGFLPTSDFSGTETVLESTLPVINSGEILKSNIVINKANKTISITLIQ